MFFRSGTHLAIRRSFQGAGACSLLLGRITPAVFLPLHSSFGAFNGMDRNERTTLLTNSRFASSLTKKTPYAILGIKRTATKEEIKKAYRVMARKHHPDAPGGDHQKFQEIQEAYEQIKTGVWIDKRGSDSGDSSDGSGGSTRPASVYSSLRYRTRTHKGSTVSYEDFYTEMHTGKTKKNPFEDDEEEAQANRRKAQDKHFREAYFGAWFRFITLWCVVFVLFRVAFFVIFPPIRKERPKKPPLPPGLRPDAAPAPPLKPLASVS